MKVDKENNNVLGEGLPQIFHDRARSATEELHKLLLSLSTGAVAVFFIALTTKIDPPLTEYQRLILIIALILMGVAVIFGIVSWYADAQRNYLLGAALQKNHKKEKLNYYRQKDFYYKIKQISAKVLVGSFSVGMISSIIYIALRIYSN